MTLSVVGVVMLVSFCIGLGFLCGMWLSRPLHGGSTRFLIDPVGPDPFLPPPKHPHLHMKVGDGEPFCVWCDPDKVPEKMRERLQEMAKALGV